MMVINHYEDPENMDSKPDSDDILTFKNDQKLN